MRRVRRALRWKLLVAVATSAAVAVLGSGALASPSEPAAAGATFQLVTAPKCAGGTTRLGRACVDRPQIPEWTIKDGSTGWNHTSGVGGLWQTSHTWTIPATSPPAGATVKLAVTAKENTNNPNARICPAIGVSGGFSVKGQSQVGTCAQGGGSASGSLAVKVVPPSATAGSTVSLTVGVQDGPIYTYYYRAIAAKKKKKTTTTLCRRPQALAGEAAKRGRLDFVFSQEGLPQKEHGLLDMTTSGIGRADLRVFGEVNDPVCDTNNDVVTVRRQVEYTTTDRHPRVVKAVLVFRASSHGASDYFPENKVGGARSLTVDLELYFSTYPKCPLPRGGRRDATLDLQDGRDTKLNIVWLEVEGCPEQNVKLIDRSGQKPPRKPVVEVSITEHY